MSERPAQSQPYPGETGEMTSRPLDEMRDYSGRGLLEGKRALVTGGDSGIGRAVAVVDYSASKAAAMNFGQSMAQVLLDRGIRVNCVAPGPVWTPLIPATFEAERVEGFGKQAPMGRAAEPDEIAPSYILFASNRLSLFCTGQNLVPAGGEIHPG